MAVAIPILTLLADGKSRTAAEMARLSGLTKKQVDAVVYLMHKNRFIRYAPTHFEITEEGRRRVNRAVERAEREARIKEERAARVAARAAAKLAPVGRPKLPEEVRVSKAQARAAARRLERQAQRLAIAQQKAAERVAAERRRAEEKEREAAEQEADLAFIHNIVEAGRGPDPLIEQAVRLQPALHSVWGAPACA